MTVYKILTTYDYPWEWTNDQLISVVGHNWVWQVGREFLIIPSWMGQLEALSTRPFLRHTHTILLCFMMIISISVKLFLFLVHLVISIATEIYWHKDFFFFFTGIWVLVSTYFLKYITSTRMWSLLWVWLLLFFGIFTLR